MGLTSAIAVYFIVWWLAFFAVLPFGVRTQDDEDDVVEGSPSSAPVRPLLLAKAAAATLISLVIFGGLYWLVAVAGVTLDDIPLLPDMRPADWQPNYEGQGSQ